MSPGLVALTKNPFEETLLFPGTPRRDLGSSGYYTTRSLSTCLYKTPKLYRERHLFAVTEAKPASYTSQVYITIDRSNHLIRTITNQSEMRLFRKPTTELRNASTTLFANQSEFSVAHSDASVRRSTSTNHVVHKSFSVELLVNEK